MVRVNSIVTIHKTVYIIWPGVVVSPIPFKMVCCDSLCPSGGARCLPPGTNVGVAGPANQISSTIYSSAIQYFSGFRTWGVNQPLGSPPLLFPLTPSPSLPSPLPPSRAPPLPLGLWNLGVGALYKNLGRVRMWGHSPLGAHPKMWHCATTLGTGCLVSACDRRVSVLLALITCLWCTT